MQERVKPTHIAIVARIVTENVLVQVQLQVLAAGVVIDAENTPFQDTPKSLDGVRRYVTVHVLTSAVIDLRVPVARPLPDETIPGVFIRI